jgi:hypothetical protein
MFRKNYNLSSIEFLEKQDLMMLKECLSHSQRLGIISERFENNWQKKIMDEASYIIGITKGREALHNTILKIKKNRTNSLSKRIETGYQISSLFLSDCYHYLKDDPRKNERIHLVTGTITAEGTKVLSRMEKLKYYKQSPAYVEADKTDSHQKIISMAENFGHYVLAVFHSHTTKGISSTTPSSIDHQFLKRMAQIGCRCLGGIFSLDGYVRFFKEKGGFDIDVYGKGIEKIEDNSNYKIFKINEPINDEQKSI